MIVSDPESGEGSVTPKTVDARPSHEIPAKGTHNAKNNGNHPNYSTHFGEATIVRFRKSPLNVANRNRKEEFGKQEKPENSR